MALYFADQRWIGSWIWSLKSFYGKSPFKKKKSTNGIFQIHVFRLGSKLKLHYLAGF